MLNTSLLKKGSTVAVALSGGKDSVCLLDLLLKNAKTLGVTVKAINVEHGIRGENSTRDTEFVKKLCKKKNVPVLCFAVDSLARAKETGESLEQAARVLRYDCFKKAILSGFCDFIATAHHQSDNAETVLLNLIRGTSLKGLCGIGETALNGQIIRPILGLSREEIDEYAQTNKLEFVTDETNYSIDFSRNYLRSEVIPKLKQKFPQFENAVSRMCRTLKADDETLDYYAERLVCFNGSPIENKASVKICDEIEKQKAIFARACLIAFKRIGFVADYTSAHINALYNLCFLQTGASVNLKCGLRAFKERDSIVIVKQKTKSAPISPLTALSVNKRDLLKNEGICFNEYIIKLLPIKNKPSFTDLRVKNRENNDFENREFYENDRIYFDFDKLPDNIEIRTRKTGDVIATFNKNCEKTKNLKKYLNDKKISARISNALPLIAKGENVFLVAKVDVSALLKIDESTQNIVKFICTTKEND